MVFQRIKPRPEVPLIEDESELPILKDYHERFVHHYCYTTAFKGSEAARLAGTKSKKPYIAAAKLLLLPKIALHVKHHKHKIKNRLKMDKDDILDGFGEVAKSKEEKTADRLRALEALAKIKGIMKPEGHTQIAIFSDADELRRQILSRHAPDLIDITPKPKEDEECQKSQAE